MRVAGKLWAGIVVTFALAGCTTTVGRNFNTDNIEQIKIGQTTTEQTVAALGEPFSRNIAADGSERWQYHLMRDTRSLTGRHFIPFVGPFLSGSGRVSHQQRTLDLEFTDNTLTSCLLKLHEGEGQSASFSAAAAGMEASSGGTTQEIACGE